MTRAEISIRTPAELAAVLDNFCNRIALLERAQKYRDSEPFAYLRIGTQVFALMHLFALLGAASIAGAVIYRMCIA